MITEVRHASFYSEFLMRAAFERRQDEPFAASTIAATRWLMRFAPERLEAWFRSHADGLERAVRASKERVSA